MEGDGIKEYQSESSNSNDTAERNGFKKRNGALDTAQIEGDAVVWGTCALSPGTINPCSAENSSDVRSRSIMEESSIELAKREWILITTVLDVFFFSVYGIFFVVFSTYVITAATARGRSTSPFMLGGE